MCLRSTALQLHLRPRGSIDIDGHMGSPATCADGARRHRRNRRSFSTSSTSSRGTAACCRRSAAGLAPQIRKPDAGNTAAAAFRQRTGRAEARRPSSHGGRSTALAVAAGLAALARGPVALAASAGGSHSCVLLNGGSVKCWGENYHGQLGQNDEVVRGKDNSTMGDALPEVPLGPFSTVFVDSGGEFNCALDRQGAVKCWGRSEYGQLGLGDNVTRGGPYTADDMGVNLPAVNLGAGAVAETIALGGMHACAVIEGGELKCWGRNDKGQLGLNDTASRGDSVNEMGDNLPTVDLGTGVVVTSVAAGEAHTCAVIGDGDVKCWGEFEGAVLLYMFCDGVECGWWWRCYFHVRIELFFCLCCYCCTAVAMYLPDDDAMQTAERRPRCCGICFSFCSFSCCWTELRN